MAFQHPDTRITYKANEVVKGEHGEFRLKAQYTGDYWIVRMNSGEMYWTFWTDDALKAIDTGKVNDSLHAMTEEMANESYWG